MSAKLAPDGSPAAFDVGAAVVNRTSKKDEDRSAVLLRDGGRASAFAVFDGHSGKNSATLCGRIVCQRLLDAKDPFDGKTVEDIFWEVDEEIGCGKAWTSKENQTYLDANPPKPEDRYSYALPPPGGCPQGSGPVLDGATAQVLLLDSLDSAASSGSLRGMFAWLGDSTAVVVDMATKQPIYDTPNHMPARETERANLELYTKIRAKVEDQNCFNTHHHETSAEQVGAAFKALAIEPKEGEVELITRALARGVLIAKTLPQNAPNRKKSICRQRSKDHDVNEVWVVATAESHSHAGYNDLQMTRSLCDWRASDMVLPHPELHRFEVPAGCHHRIILASDGLWDVCTPEQAAEVLHACADPLSAAKKLLEIAEFEYIENRGHEMMDDDTTVLVVDVNATGRPFKVASAGGGCCTLS
jgi:serine/threonine protein phosphatase PrpC